MQGKTDYTPPARDPSFLGLSPDPEVTEQKKAMVYTKQCSKLPSDTELLLTKNYSELIIFGKLRISRVVP